MLLITASKSFLVRGLLAAHATLCIWRVVVASGFDQFWYFALIHYVILLFEGLVTLVATKKGEWTAFSPCVLIYLLTVIPCIWILEFNLYIQRHQFADDNDVDCETIVTYNISSVDLDIIPIQLQLDYQQWSLALQQTFIFVLIIGRWLLPKGHMTRDQLSQLLLVYIGMAADILEFITEGISIGPVSCSLILMTMILGIWSWSLLQFTIGLTLTKRRKIRVAGTGSPRTRCSPCLCCETEVWAILVTVIMQDGPFLAMRIYIITQFDFISQMMLFFTAKNALVLFLQLYRLVVLFCEKADDAPSMSYLERRQSEGSSVWDAESNHAIQHLSKSNMVVTSSVDDDWVDKWTHTVRIFIENDEKLMKPVDSTSSITDIHTTDDELNLYGCNANNNPTKTATSIPVSGDTIVDKSSLTKADDFGSSSTSKHTADNDLNYIHDNHAFLCNESINDSNGEMTNGSTTTSLNGIRDTSDVEKDSITEHGEIKSTNGSTRTSLNGDTAVHAPSDVEGEDSVPEHSRTGKASNINRMKAYTATAFTKLNSMTSVISTAITKLERHVGLSDRETNVNAGTNNADKETGSEHDMLPTIYVSNSVNDDDKDEINKFDHKNIPVSDCEINYTKSETSSLDVTIKDIPLNHNKNIGEEVTTSIHFVEDTVF